MKPILTIMAVLALAVAGPACGDDKKGGEKSAGAEAPKPDPKPVEPATDKAPPPEEEAAVPTAEDFEEEADKGITPDTLEKDVTAIEAELDE